MDSWHTTVETPAGMYYSPPEDEPAAFFLLLRQLARELPPEETVWKITHRREGHDPPTAS